MARMFHDALARLGGDPLITHYDQDSRIELSGETFRNWVMKTANLVEELDVDPAEPIALGLSDTDPGHWVSLIWVAAAWFAGGHAVQGVPDQAELAVVGPEDPRRGRATVACTLHPLGRGFAEVPAGAIDYADVLTQPDLALAGSPAPEDPAWGDVTHGELAGVEGRSDRRLFVDPHCGWEFLRDALVAPVIGGGSTVIVTGLDAGEVERVQTSERAVREG